MNHFNAAHIWGRLASFEQQKSKNDKPYLDIKVECNSREYGNVIAFCRLWGKKKVEDFQKAFKPGDTVYLKSMLSQYTGRKERIYTNFNVFKCSPWDPAADKHSTHRAVFILIGTVLTCENVEGDERLIVEVRLKDETAKFEIFIPAENLLDIGSAPKEGTTAHFKGVIDIETDQYGDIITGPRPVVEQVKVDGVSESDAPF